MATRRGGALRLAEDLPCGAPSPDCRRGPCRRGLCRPVPRPAHGCHYILWSAVQPSQTDVGGPSWSTPFLPFPQLFVLDPSGRFRASRRGPSRGVGPRSDRPAERAENLKGSAGLRRKAESEAEPAGHATPQPGRPPTTLQPCNSAAQAPQYLVELRRVRHISAGRTHPSIGDRWSHATTYGRRIPPHHNPYGGLALGGGRGGRI